jgi:hypothetical protein
MEERDMQGQNQSRTPEPSLLDQVRNFVNSNMRLIRGTVAIFIGIYLLGTGVVLFIRMAAVAVGGVSIMYGLSELRVTSLTRLFNSAKAKLGL